MELISKLVSHQIATEVNNPEEPILLMPVGDIQWAGVENQVAMRMLRDHIQWGVDHNAYFLGMGDYIDYMSPSGREAYKGAKKYDSTLSVNDRAALMLVDELYDRALAPSKGRWLGLLEGHHFHETTDGLTTDMYLADKLGAEFLGSSAYVRLRFSYVRGKGESPHVKYGDVLIWCHHGVGTGQTSAAVLNKLLKMSTGFDADIYLMAHLHRKVAEPIDYTFPVYFADGETRLAHRTRIMACTGSFLKGYVEGNVIGRIKRGTYVEQKMLTPVALGGVVVTIKPRWKRVGDSGEIWLPDLGVSQ